MSKIAALKQHFDQTFDANSKIIEMTPYEMICHLQTQFNHKENSIPFDDKEQLELAFRLLKNENDETRDDGLIPRNLKLLRDGIADQLTIAYFLAFKVEGLKQESHHHIHPKIPNTYTEYCQAVDEWVERLEDALFSKNNREEAQNCYLNLLANLYNLPEFSNIDPHLDLIDTTFSSLSKICSTEEIANRTLEAYKEKGYKCHIEKTPTGWGIFITEDSFVKNTMFPRGKFLKSLYLIEPLMEDIDEDTVW